MASQTEKQIITIAQYLTRVKLAPGSRPPTAAKTINKL